MVIALPHIKDAAGCETLSKANFFLGTGKWKPITDECKRFFSARGTSDTMSTYEQIYCASGST